jgi:hypothetical protein
MKYYVFGHYLSSCLYLKTVSLFLKLNVSETGFCLRLQVKPTLLGPIDRASPYLRTVCPFEIVNMMVPGSGKMSLQSSE